MSHPRTSATSLRHPTLLVHLILAWALRPGVDAALATVGLETRDAAYWPFASTSPWNMPIGDKAEFAQPVSEVFSPTKGGTINCGHWSHPIFIAAAADPLVDIYRKGAPGKPFATMRVPADARPDDQSDGHLHIIDETHAFVVEMWQASRGPKGSITASAVVRNDLRYAGVYDRWHSVRAYGGSALGGIIRQGELSNGIRHALSVGIHGKAMNSVAPGGKHWVWPASCADHGDGRPSARTGNLHMGSLMAIPPGVDLESLNLSSLQATNLAKALQDYGAYLSDMGDNNFALAAEPTPQTREEVAKVSREDCARLVAHLQLVSNNAPTSIGGGGTPRRPLAPPIAAPGAGH